VIASGNLRFGRRQSGLIARRQSHSTDFGISILFNFTFPSAFLSIRSNGERGSKVTNIIGWQSGKQSSSSASNEAEMNTPVNVEQHVTASALIC
jgi:hypothetical protein